MKRRFLCICSFEKHVSKQTLPTRTSNKILNVQLEFWCDTNSVCSHARPAVRGKHLQLIFFKSEGNSNKGRLKIELPKN